ncbi:SusC/RagA family TonB-linked outer membrane protein [Winogradskyella litoriviva]|uniref:SusC/RagA family TonB-linked outer membrane protein n=1 Tax=Winogradskyella litoriviva TaxID=1220182 RepID=A0ABX2DYV8_9FLAO|nr:SusC/RagA family TonB-linked outer membrane protein [Winogradskyella litoriviva]NRD21605.1 SusC/RagA family TonB-linked outer membrane protein [Winogradskyella litoriviva]
MKLKLTWLLTLFMAFVMQFSFAQEKTVTGTVTTKSDGLPLPGASVIVKGTSKGQQTDFDGKFTIKVNQGDVLVISYVGMTPGEVTIGAGSTYNVALEDANALDEVVVVGYGTTTKEAFTGSAATVDVEEIEAKTFSNVSQALRGEAAGVNVIQTTGQPGTSATIRIRGFGSVNGNRDPLYVVDGVPYGGQINAINQNDIKSLIILKDAAATSIYGSRGANGVVLITTNKGSKTKSFIDVDFKTSVSSFSLPTYDVIESPEEYIELSWDAVRTNAMLSGNSNPAQYASNNLFDATNGISPYYNLWDTAGSQLINPTTGEFNSGVTRRYTPENWADYAFRTGYRQEANISMSGGNETTTYSTSLGFLNDDGAGINSDFRRYTGRINVDHEVNDWLKVGANVTYTGSRTTQNGQTTDTGSIFLMANASPRIYSIFLRDQDGNKIYDPIFGGSQFDYGDNQFNNGIGDNSRRFSTATNGIADATYNLTRSYDNSLFGNVYFNIDLAKGLTLENRYGTQRENFDYSDRDNPYYGAAAAEDIYGRLFKRISTRTNDNFLTLLRYKTSFGANDKHSLEVFGAHEATSYEFNRMYAYKSRAILPNTLDLDQYTTTIGKPGSYSLRWTLESYFGQMNYDLDDKYYLTASIRRDGSSRFINDKWGTFWSVGAGWIMSKEDFMSSVNAIDYFKLKGSYGVIGDQGDRLRYGWQIFGIGNTDEYSFTPDTERSNPDLTWETKKITSFGFESTWFNNTLDVNVDYYIANTENLFFEQSLPGSSGFISSFINDGKLTNKGLEFDINANIIQPKNSGDFSLSLGVNGEMLSNEITEMPIDQITGEVKIFDDRGGSIFAISEGKSVYDFFTREWAGVDAANGSGLWNLYYDDIDGNGIYNEATDVAITNMVLYKAANANANVNKTTTTVYSEATQKYIGKSSIPKLRGAFRLNLGYKNFSLATQFSYSIGGYAYDSNYRSLMGNGKVGSDNWHTDVRDRWQQPGDITNIPRLSDDYSADANFDSTSSRFLTKADYLSLNNLQLGYTLTENALKDTGISRLNVYVSGDNLLLFTHRDGFNPATSESGNSSIYRYPPMTVYSLGLKIQF